MRRRAARRALGYGLCLGCGVAVGVLVERFTGSQLGFLAIPILVAAAWLVVANPEQCAGRRSDF